MRDGLTKRALMTLTSTCDGTVKVNHVGKIDTSWDEEEEGLGEEGRDGGGWEGEGREATEAVKSRGEGDG